MDPSQQDALVKRLIANPHDQSAIAEAHTAGQQNPEAYARLLERVGQGTAEPALASHWLCEAANVWQTTFGDVARTAEALLQAVDRQPTADQAYARLEELYRTATDETSLTALMERRAHAFEKHSERDASLRPRAVALFREVAQRLEQREPARSRSVLRHVVELEPSDQLAIYTLREAHKAASEYSQALTLFEPELRLEQDPERRKALRLDEAEVAKRAGDVPAGYAALQQLTAEFPDDVVIKAQAASWLLEVYRAGLEVPADSKQGAGRAFVELAEAYPGEHGLAYAVCALELMPADDRAVQLAMYYGEQLQRLAEVAPMAAAYVAANPQGVLVAQARQVAGDTRPWEPPVPAAARKASAAPAAGSSGTAGVAPAVGEVRAAFESVDGLLERAEQLAKRGRKNEAIQAFRQVLELEPTNGDALSYLLEQLPLKRRYAELKDVLLAASASSEADVESQVRWLQEVAGLCENQLRDLEGAVHAWERIVRLDPSRAAYDQLRRLLERAQSWDELAEVLAQEAADTEDVEARIAIERHLARVHAEQRKDAVAAGSAWARVAGLSRGDEDALNEAVRLFETASRPDLAADAIAQHIATLDDAAAKRGLYIKLGDLRAAQGLSREGGEALAEGAAELGDAALWGRAEHYFVHAKAWEQAASAANEQVELTEAAAEQAALLARAANYSLQMGEREDAVARLERAVELAPTVEEYSALLEQQLVAAGRVGELAALFLTRADKMSDRAARVAIRKRAAKIQRDHLEDVDAARASYLMVLRDMPDAETLLWLANDAERRQDLEASVGYLARLVEVVEDPSERSELALREARLRARGLSDSAGAIERLHFVLDELDPNCQPAMTEIADLEQAQGNHVAAAQILERHFEVAGSQETKLDVAARLAEIYERRLHQVEDAIRVLSFIHQADPADLDATQRLCALAEDHGKWELVAKLMHELVPLEDDVDEASRMTRRLAQVYADRLDRGEEGLRVLAEAGTRGDEACRDAFIELGDRLGNEHDVARQLVQWYSGAPVTEARTEAMHAAFERFVSSGHETEALAVAADLGKSRSARLDIAETLETIAVRARDLDALHLAHELRAAPRTGQERGEELVRQAEVLATLEVPSAEAILHGESGLVSVEPDQVEPLLARLAGLTKDASAKVDVYERQIPRCKTPEARLAALCRAAEVAAELDDIGRAQAFFQIALSGSVAEEGLEQVVDLVRIMDQRRQAAGDATLRRILAEALASGGQGARDGGKTRSRMLRRAAKLAQFELDATEQALTWIGDALAQFVETESLEALDDIASAVGDWNLADGVASRALEEVFDGPMVRELLRYRADLREAKLGDSSRAAEDLRRLHDLNPSDLEVNGQLAALYDKLGDYVGMVKLHEDQIVRSRDQAHRAELAREVARLWQDKLTDPRETADAWRRVLRLNPGDEEAKVGLARAKEAMLQGRPSSPDPLPPPVVGAPPDTLSLTAPNAEDEQASLPDLPDYGAARSAPNDENFSADASSAADGDVGAEAAYASNDASSTSEDAGVIEDDADADDDSGDEADEPSHDVEWTASEDGDDDELPAVKGSEPDTTDADIMVPMGSVGGSAAAVSASSEEYEPADGFLQPPLDEEDTPDVDHEELEIDDAEVIDVEPDEEGPEASLSSRPPAPPSRRASAPPSRREGAKVPPPPPQPAYGVSRKE